jgi:hypothetical protein
VNEEHLKELALNKSRQIPCACGKQKKAKLVELSNIELTPITMLRDHVGNYTCTADSHCNLCQHETQFRALISVPNE